MSKKTLENVLEVCCTNHSVSFSSEEQARDFLVRQEKREQARHPEYDLDFKKRTSPSEHGPYFSTMVDKLLLFAYLTGENEMNHASYDRNDQNEFEMVVNPMKIESEQDLYVLRFFEMGFSGKRSKPKRTDETLFKLVGRTQSSSRRNITSQGWGGVITEILADEEVINYFDGKALSYGNVAKSIAPDALRQYPVINPKFAKTWSSLA